MKHERIVLIAVPVRHEATSHLSSLHLYVMDECYIGILCAGMSDSRLIRSNWREIPILGVKESKEWPI